MSFHVSTYALSKRGQEPDENQDAFRPLLTERRLRRAESARELHQSSLIAAIADGATEGMLSEIWARILVSNVSKVESLFAEADVGSLLNRASSAWKRFKRRKLSAGKRLTRLPIWLEEPGLEQGAFSTVAAIRFDENQTWTAVAVGDSCLFQVRANELRVRWPIQSSAEFAKRPYLLCSEQGPGPQLDDNTASLCGRWSVDDHFFLMSDAFACWFIRKFEQGEKPWMQILELGTDGAEGNFETMVTHLREKDGLRNDDVTLIRIHAF